MNVKGFEDDARLIKARLKDIDAVPEIERDLGVLREKIKSKHEHKEQDSKDFQKFKHESQEIKKDNVYICNTKVINNQSLRKHDAI